MKCRFFKCKLNEMILIFELRHIVGIVYDYTLLTNIIWYSILEISILQQKTSCPCLKEEYHIACNEISRSYHQTWMKFKCIPEWAKILLLEKRLVDETERGQIAMTTLGRCIFVWSISLSCLRFYLMWNDLHYYFFFRSKIDFQTKI